MKENVIIEFNIDYEVSIYADNELIGKSGYKDTFKYLVEKDCLLTFKKGAKKAIIKVFKDKENKIEVGYSPTGQLKASYKQEKEESAVNQEKPNNLEENKTENVVASNPNVQNTQKQNSDTASTIIGILVILAIIYGVYNIGSGFFNKSDSNNNTNEKGKETPEDKERDARTQIQALIRNAPDKYIYLYSTYSIGKITSADCSSSENEYDNNGRYLMRCSYKYNPKNGAGSTMLDREHKGDVYALYMDNGDGTFAYKFGHAGTAYKDKFKSDYCWGKEKSLKFNCKQ